jgi:PAS domain S-box-containing protein
MPGRDIVSFRPLSLSDAAVSPLFLYRVVPRTVLDAPVQRFLRWVVTAGLLVVGAVLGLATIAAAQLTKPIYQLRESARRLARGEEQPSLAVGTNDELEDLAHEFTGMAAILQDHRLRLEDLVIERTRALQATHAELTDILAYSADAIIGIDENEVIQVWNRGAEALFGYPAEEARGQRVDGLIGPPGQTGVREREFVLRQLERHGAVVNFPCVRVSRDGIPIPSSLTETVIRDEGGRFLSRSLIIRDRRLQAQLEELMRRSERLATTSVMAAGLAHELNNPLAIIGNRIECMQRDFREGDAAVNWERDLQVLQQHVDRLRGLVTSLLGFGRGDAAQLLPVDLNEMVRRVAGLLESTSAGRDIRLEVQAAENLPCVRGDVQALETVCGNLVMNALDATPAGGEVRVTTRVSSRGEAVEMEVADTGGGIPEELRGRIFEPFFTTKGSRGGTGLGLAVSRSIVEHHGGEIRVASTAGEGSRFVVTLPAGREDA